MLRKILTFDLDKKFQYGESDNSEVDGPPGPPVSTEYILILFLCTCFLTYYLYPECLQV